MNSSTKTKLLEQIATITAMERGKLSAYIFKDRPAAAGPYHKLQYWREGKNHTRYVSEEERPAVEAALAGHARFQQLTQEYADMVIAETREQIAGLKKKPAHGKSDWRRRRKSSN